MKEIPIRQIKPAGSESNIPQTFRIRSVEAIMDGRAMKQDLHRHDFFFVLALGAGRGTHVIDFVSYEVRDNCIFIMKQGQVHELSLKVGCKGYLMEFNTEFYRSSDRGSDQILRRATAANLCRVDRESFKKLSSILTTIFQEYQDKKDGYKQVIRAALDIFFIEFARNRKETRPASKASSYEQERLEKFLDMIETNVARIKQVSQYADMLNLSVYQLSAITKRVLGKTPSALIDDYIILESKRYLLATTDQVNQIAWHLGYDDPSYFIRFFKKHTGYSPESFRSNSR